MIDTEENIKETIKEMEKLMKECGVTDETSSSPEYDYIEED